MRNRNILISGAGIAGPTLAYWLKEHGFCPTIVERAPNFRTGGYIIDFWGLGFEVADRMKVLPELRNRGYIADEVRLLNARGEKVGGFDAEVFRSNLGNRYLTIQRSDLAEVINDKIKDDVEIIFADSVSALQEDEEGVEVGFEKGPTRRFDLVIGADGLHSIVRNLTFGNDSICKKDLGYYAAAFTIEGYRPRNAGVYVCYSTPGKQLARFALRGDRTAFFLIFSEKHMKKRKHENDKKRILEDVFADACWESESVIKAMHASEDFYFDSVSQIRLPTWSKGRIALAGDAAFCPSLLAGQGAAVAMLGSYVLAGELKLANGDYASAFLRYEQLLSEFMFKKQKGAERIGTWFAPRSALGVFVRNQVTQLFSMPFFADKVVSLSIADNLCVPDYEKGPVSRLEKIK